MAQAVDSSQAMQQFLQASKEPRCIICVLTNDMAGALLRTNGQGFILVAGQGRDRLVAQGLAQGTRNENSDSYLCHRVTMGSSSNLSVPPLPICEMGAMILTLLFDCKLFRSETLSHYGFV